MAATIRASSRVYPTTGTSTAVAKPTGTAAGDYLIAFMFCDNDGSVAALTAPASTGGGTWAELSNSGGTAGTVGGFGRVFATTATSSEPSTYTFGHPNAATVSAPCIEIYAITGQNSSTPIAATPVWSRVAPATTTSLVAPTVTMAAAGLLMCRYHEMGATAAATITPASGMAGTSSQKSDNFLLMLGASQSVASGATGTKTATSSNAGSTTSQGYLTVSMGVRDAAGTSVGGTGSLVGVGSLSASGTTASSTTTGLAAVGSLSAAAVATAKISGLIDDFASVDGAKWQGLDGANPTVVGGQASITLTNGYPGFSSVKLWDLTGSSFALQLPQMPNTSTPSAGLFIQLEAGADTNNHVRWNWDDNASVAAVYRVNGTDTLLGGGAVPFTAGMWVRLRESGGTVFWDYSLNGLSWTVWQSWVSTLPLTAVRANLYGGYYNAADPAPNVPALLDNVNNLPSPTGTGSLAGIGSLTASGARADTSPAMLVGVGNLAASGARGDTGTAILAGLGTLSASRSRTDQRTATLAGVGSITANWARADTRSATLAGLGQLTASAGKADVGGATLAGVGALTGQAFIGDSRTAALTGVGSLTAAGQKADVGGVSLLGVGAITAAGARADSIAALPLAGLGSLAASASTGASGVAALVGVGSLTGQAARLDSRTAALVGSGSLTAAAAQVGRGAVQLAGIGGLSASAGRGDTRSCVLAGLGGLAATGSAFVPGQRLSTRTRVRVTGTGTSVVVVSHRR